MQLSEHPAAPFKITAVCTVTDPAERQRRLARVFGLILDAGRQKRMVTQVKPGTPTHLADQVQSATG
jgi:predicted fused transcriptional regulator/phosphomethylpyrimidine kinase